MPDLIGKTLGPYRIVEQIGLGGMSTVYKAYQPSMDRYVALKVLSTHLTQDPSFVKRFQQEAKVIAKLEHLHILPVYDHGEEDSYLYLVMRFIEAGTLKDRLEDGPLSLGEARQVVMQVGSALEYAHQLGVVHRDLKPSNILIDAQGDCYLTDFGIAKMVESTLGLTGSAILGTPHYMAPEQSQSLKVDHRADIYAMGVIIYQMVTGQLPFDAETPVAVALKHISEPLPLPRSLKPDLPESVERVIFKALAKDPADRYQSMRDLVSGFDQAVQNAQPESSRVAATSLALSQSPTIQEEAAEPTSVVDSMAPAPDTRRWAGIHPLWLLGAAGLALLVLVLAGLILSRIPGRVEISGGQVQVVLPTSTEEAVAVVGATPTETSQEAASTPTAPQPTATPTHTTSPTTTTAPTDTPIPMPTPTATRGPTSTPTPIPLPDAVVSAQAANLRAGPGTSYPVVGQAERDDGLQVEGRNADGDWLRVVTSDGTQGWVSDSLVDLNLALDGVAVASIPPTPAPSLADKASAFAEPILASIAGRPPDYEDDFDDPGSGWSVGTEIGEPGGGGPGGEAGYEAGEYFTYVPSDRDCRTGYPSTLPEFSDFVLEVDANFASAGDGDWQVTVRHPQELAPHGGYVVVGQYYGPVDLIRDEGLGVTTYLAGNQATFVNPGQVNHVQIVAKGPKIAVAVNDEWAVFVTDPEYTRQGQVNLAVCRHGDTPMRIQWDNLRIWDISDGEPIQTAATPVPPSPMSEQARAFAGPYLAAVASLPPDFEDDFATADKGWNAAYGTHGNEGTFAIEDGVARFRLGQADMYMIHEALTRKDFVLQADARLADGDLASEMQVYFHNLTQDFWYNANLLSGLGSWRVGKMWEGQHKELATGVGSVGGLGETTQVTVVARGPRAAVYLDGRPVAYFEDGDFDTAGKTLLMCTSYSQAVCEFDNVRFWDLDNVPAPPSGETASVPQPISLNVRAYIDGQSRLFIHGDSVHWHHIGATAPGRQFVNEPTYLNGEAWYPDWPDVPDSLNTNCDCDSSTFVGIPALGRKDQSVNLEVIQARHEVSIVQQPNAGNDYTLVVEFDDLPPDGADWYEINLGYSSD